MTGSRRPLRSLLAFLAFCVAIPIAAQEQHPNQSRGLSGVFNANGIDNVSLFNGALQLTIPLSSYPVGGDFSYGFVLSYNSNLWDYETVWNPQELELQTEAEPHETFNAGFGWTLTLGRLLPPFSPENPSERWLYLSPDGGGHSFYQAQHEDVPDNDPDTLYTRDGSYLRMKVISTTERRIETPDGGMRKFVKNGGRWELRRIQDVTGFNYLQIAYATDPQTGDETWTLSDRHGRQHYVRLTPMVWLNQTIYQVDLETVGGQRALYDFQYVTQQVSRSCKDTYTLNDDRISVPHLTRVTLPDGSYFSMKDPGVPPSYYNICEGGVDDVPGVLREIQLPTGARIAYEFQEVDFPPGGQQNTFDSSAGVKTRTLLASDGVTPIGTWTYKTTLVPGGEGTHPEMQTDVVYPTGDCSKHYFDGLYYRSNSSWAGWEYGLPFVARESSGDRYLSSEVYSSSMGTSCAGTKLRTTYLRFDHDKLPHSVADEDAHGWYNSNRRVSGTKTVFHDDGDRWVDTAMSEFDGVGHYRSVVTSGDFTGATQTRTVYTGFNPERGIYAYGPGNNPCCGHDFTPVDPADPWILGTFTHTESAEPGATGETVARSSYSWDANGQLSEVRVFESGTTPGDHDVVAGFTRNGYGDITSVRLYGGDLQDLGALEKPDPAYRTDFTYQYGGVRTVRDYRSDGTPMPHLKADFDRDPSTGRVVTSRSPSGFVTTYLYDSIGRPSAVVPQAGAATSYAYTAPAPGVPARVKTARTAAFTVLEESEIVYDELGRVWKERLNTPDHGWVERETLYNARGWVTSRSQLGFPGKTTQYSQHDPFGRPGRITPPDGTDHDVWMSYDGVRRVVTQSKVATSIGVEESVSREQLTDSFGRLHQVLEASGSGGAMVPTTYSYDVGGRLTRILTDDPGSANDQIREFTYDNRGFLLAERHPEKGLGGNGWVTYSGYDPRGNVGRKVDGPNTLDYVYDAVGRLLRVEDANQGNRAVKEYVYDGAPGLGAGKVWQAIRHNFVDLPWTGPGEDDVVVTETYTYNGPAGQVSERLTQIDPMGYSFSQSFGYEATGKLASLGYPDCLHALCPGDEPARTVDYEYDLGFLTAVPGWADSITYHQNGLWSEVHHTNGVVDDQNRDPDGLPRSKRIRTFGALDAPGGNPAEFDTYVYSYDGSGNIKAIGPNDYVYDKVGRLVQGDAAGQTQQYAFDVYGNINSVTTITGGVPSTYMTATNPLTNRLQDAIYDEAGSMTSWSSFTYGYDALNRMSSQTYPGGEKLYVYTADGERIWVIDDAAELTETVHLRSLGGKLLRTYAISDRDTSGETWSWKQDHVFRAGVALASELADGSTRHFHLDHLGSTRMLTDEQGVRLGRWDFFPFGGEAQIGPAEAVLFTGHERDVNSAGSAGVQDFMHARFYSPHLGRLLRTDPLHGSPGAPQRLNRYAYVVNSPLIYVDPDGKDPVTVGAIVAGAYWLADASDSALLDWGLYAVANMASWAGMTEGLLLAFVGGSTGQPPVVGAGLATTFTFTYTMQDSLKRMNEAAQAFNEQQTSAPPDEEDDQEPPDDTTEPPPPPPPPPAPPTPCENAPSGCSPPSDPPRPDACELQPEACDDADWNYLPGDVNPCPTCPGFFNPGWSGTVCWVTDGGIECWVIEAY